VFQQVQENGPERRDLEDISVGLYVPLLGTPFYGFETYNMLVNPNNRLVKKELMRWRLVLVSGSISPRGG
jgi:hypothetical protein